MEDHDELIFPSERFLGPSERQRNVARYLYDRVAHLPILSPHGHVSARLFVDPQGRFGSPAELLIQPDHYVFRMLYSQGIALEQLGIAPLAGGDLAVENDARKVWQVFAENFHLFRGTPTGLWLNYEFSQLFEVRQKLNGHTAQAVYDQIEAKLGQPEFRPRALFERFNIEALCTTDAAQDTLSDLQALRASGWSGRVLPTFRPDDLLDLQRPDWAHSIAALSQVSGIEVNSCAAFIHALEQRRAFFKEMGATATDHGAETPFTAPLSPAEAEAIFQRALHGQASPDDAARFMGHMLIEMARMSSEDGLVMQLHVGSYRNHNTPLLAAFGRDRGADIPLATEFTRNLQPLLARFGSHPNLTLIVFTLDETTYARELAPLAGHYPALRLGPPWWFHDSLNGMQRYFEQVMETAGLYNTVGFNDDTRSFTSIPARHDLWRRAAANWVGGLVARHVVDLDDAEAMIVDLAYSLAKRAYKL